jgi:hypothetical protein
MMQWKFWYFLQKFIKLDEILHNKNLTLWSLNLEIPQIIHLNMKLMDFKCDIIEYNISYHAQLMDKFVKISQNDHEDSNLWLTPL